MAGFAAQRGLSGGISMRFQGFAGLLFSAASAMAQADLPLADFDGPDYAGWTPRGAAFGAKPAAGTLPNQQVVSGFEGAGLVNSYLGGDAPTGALESPVFTLQRDYLNFLVGGGSHDGTRVELIVEGQVELMATGIESERLFWTTWNIKRWAGKQARVRLIDESSTGWGHILADGFSQGNAAKAFQEPRRPQFHFTAAKGWLNDPNGLVYYDGEYHLFYQHNPYGLPWGNMTWGHAVSPDLIHWEHLPLAITPDNEKCTAYSGSAVVDWNNTAGLQKGPEKTLVILWTSFGCGQRLAYSNDRGRTWTKMDGAVIPQEGEARDPKVFWHGKSKKWVMAIWTDQRGNGISFYTSPNLKDWTWTSIATGYFECPNIWEAPVDGNPRNTKWVLYGADGKYTIGDFNGTKWTAEAGPFAGDYGKHSYASQIFADIPAADGRTLNITWMRADDGFFKDSPFNQQMGIPVALELRTTSAGLRLARTPVKEIEVLRVNTAAWKDLTLSPGVPSPLAALSGELFDISAVVEPGTATEFGFQVGSAVIAYRPGAKTLSVLGNTAPMGPVGGRIKIRALLDRHTLEVFGNDGEVQMSFKFDPGLSSLEAYAAGGNAKVVAMEVHRLRGAWDPGDLAEAWQKAKNPVALVGREKARAPSLSGHLSRWVARKIDALGRSIAGMKIAP